MQENLEKIVKEVEKINTDLLLLENVEKVWKRYRKIAEIVCGNSKFENGKKQIDWWSEGTKREIKTKEKKWKRLLTQEN